MFRLFTSVSLLLMALISFSADAEVRRGQKTFGLTAGVNTCNKAPTAGLQFSYAFSPHFVLAPGIDYIFRNEGEDALSVNIDYHGPWNLTGDGRWFVYHIVGVNYASWSTRHPKQQILDYSATPGVYNSSENDDVSERHGRFGLDFGAGVGFNVTPSLRLSMQGKFNWLSHHNTGMLNVGISYVF